MDKPAHLAGVWLECDGCTDYREYPNGRNAILERMGWGLVYLKTDIDRYGNGGCWCYPDYASALAALDAWDGEGEPLGWHRHPDTGRRRENGDPAKEEIR
jgi:hypothetical protein